MYTYKKKKDDIIFDLSLSRYLMSYRSGSNDNKTVTTCETLQDVEYWLFENFESHAPYIDKDSLQYIDEEKAIKYLVKNGFTKKEIKEHNETLEDDLLRAISDAKDSSFQYEWITEYKSQLEEQIEKDLPEEATLLTSLQNPKAWELESVKVSVSYKDIMEALGDVTDLTEDEKMEQYFDDYLIADCKELNTEFIDYYGTIGDYDNWLEPFTEMNQIEEEMKETREYKADQKINPDTLKKDIADIIDKATARLDTYKASDALKNNINRNLKSIKKITK